MASMNLKVMRSKIQYMAGMITAGEVRKSLKEIPVLLWNQYINTAAEEISKMGIIKDRWADCTTVADQNKYSLPAYAHKLWHVLVYDSDNEYYIPLQSTTYTWLDDNIPTWRGDDSETYPQYYVRVGKSLLFVYPAFDDEVATGLQIYYKRLEDDLTDDTDTPKIPAEFHDAIVHLAFIKMFDGHIKFPELKTVVQSCKEDYSRQYDEIVEFCKQSDLARPLIMNPGD